MQVSSRRKKINVLVLNILCLFKVKLHFHWSLLALEHVAVNILLPQFKLPLLLSKVQQSILMTYWHISYNKLQQEGQTK